MSTVTDHRGTKNKVPGQRRQPCNFPSPGGILKGSFYRNDTRRRYGKINTLLLDQLTSACVPEHVSWNQTQKNHGNHHLNHKSVCLCCRFRPQDDSRCEGEIFIASRCSKTQTLQRSECDIHRWLPGCGHTVRWPPGATLAGDAQGKQGILGIKTL